MVVWFVWCCCVPARPAGVPQLSPGAEFAALSTRFALVTAKLPDELKLFTQPCRN